MAERGEPQIPIETGLIRCVDARSFSGILRLVAEWIRDPILAVVRALKFDFVAAAGHHGEEAVAIGHAKWLQGGDGRVRKWHGGPDHQEQEYGAGVEEA